MFEEIRNRVPELVSSLEPGTSGGVVAEISFSIQPTLDFEVLLQVQEDALCLGVGSFFWAEYFPLEDQATAATFRRAADGILHGSSRVVEQLQSGRVVKAELQESDGDAWRTIATSGKLHLPFGPRDSRVLMRVPESPSLTL